MAKAFTAIRPGSRWVFMSALSLMVITTAFIVAVITNLSLFRETPLLFTVILAGIAIGFGLMVRHRFYLPVLRNLRIRGKLFMAPLLLLVLSAPAAVIYLYYDLTGRMSLLLLSELITSFGAAFWFSSMAVVTLPAMGSVLMLSHDDTVLYDDKKISDPWQGAIIASSILAVLIVSVSQLTETKLSGTVFFLPLAATLMMLLDVVLAAHFRQRLASRMLYRQTVPGIETGHQTPHEPEEGFINVVLVNDHYPDLISGKTDYLIHHAGDTYARELISIAARTFDPALIPALKIIASGSRFSEKTRQEAASGVAVVEKYYSDPVRHSDLLRLPGIHERTATARGIMLNRSKPQEQEIMKMLSDPNPDIRRTALLASGRYGMTSLKHEVIKALGSQETAREAYYALRQFGPEVYGDMIGIALKTASGEREYSIIMKLLDAMPLSDALQWLTGLIATGNMGIRLKAASSLCERSWKPQGIHRQKTLETVNETIRIIARLIVLQSEAIRERSFLLASSLATERRVCSDFLFALLSLLEGRNAAEAMMPRPEAADSFMAGITSEAVETFADELIRRQLRALVGNSNDSDRLAELSLCYPIRTVKDRSLSSFILASEQNITGTWTKACALHKSATEARGLDREQAVSYLFSNIPVLQEESALALRAVNPGWYSETEPRLQEPSRTRISAVVKGTVPLTAMIFEKTRFLSLCFSKIPEEKLILLASGMRYSETYDTTSLPGVISWVVPSANGKTGLYSLPVSDIERFVFYYSEFTDIFVNYMDNPGGLTVS